MHDLQCHVQVRYIDLYYWTLHYFISLVERTIAVIEYGLQTLVSIPRKIPLFPMILQMKLILDSH